MCVCTKCVPRCSGCEGESSQPSDHLQKEVSPRRSPAQPHHITSHHITSHHKQRQRSAMNQQSSDSAKQYTCRSSWTTTHRNHTNRAQHVLQCLANVLQRLTVAQNTHRRSEEHTSELQSLMTKSNAVSCLKKK